MPICIHYNNFHKLDLYWVALALVELVQVALVQVALALVELVQVALVQVALALVELVQVALGQQHSCSK
jgi:hypothetical protein